MNENEPAAHQGPNRAAAVCAHIGIGADDEQAKAARDRLANVLALYRGAIVADH